MIVSKDSSNTVEKVQIDLYAVADESIFLQIVYKTKYSCSQHTNPKVKVVRVHVEKLWVRSYSSGAFKYVFFSIARKFLE